MAAVQAANLLRVISLYYVGQWNRDVFEFARLYLWQALIMRDVLVVWLLWLRWVAHHAGGSLAVCKCRDMTGDHKTIVNKVSVYRLILLIKILFSWSKYGQKN